MSGETSSARTVVVPEDENKVGRQLPGVPVDAANEEIEVTATAEPDCPSGGVSELNVPPANTVFPDEAKAQTVPLVCHVGRSLAVTVNPSDNADAGADATDKPVATIAPIAKTAKVLRIA